MANSFFTIISFFLMFFFPFTGAARLGVASTPSASATTAPKNHVCDPARFAGLGLDVTSLSFCDKSLSFEVRAKDLVGRMNLQEKANQLGNKALGVQRLGIPAYNWWSEGLHGVSDVGGGSYFDATVPGATSFPTPLLTAASFNETLWEAIGQAVSTEARAMHNLGHAGVTYWSPNVNVVRDPRWGRALETPGEDPLVVGTYSSDYVKGLQNVKGHETAKDLNSRPLKVSACCKHYAAYDVDHWKGVDRQFYSANVTEQDMVETFLKPFEMCIKDGDVSSIMCSYNDVNGIPACADARLLRQTIRSDWNLHGYIVSDCDSVEVIYDDQKWLDDTREDAVAQVLRAGLDLDCGDFYPKYIEPALMKGLIKEQDVDKALRNLYVVQMRLGLFDGSPNYESLGASDVCSQENIDLATEAAREGIVLLKNKNTSPNLPLNRDQIKKIAVIGPHANATIDMIGNYHGVPCRYVSPIEGLSKYAEVDYQIGCENVLCKNLTLFFPAMRAAQEADATIIFVGLSLNVEAESLDRTDLRLPGYQYELIDQVLHASKGPVHLVILSAGGVDVSDLEQNDNIRSIIWAGYPGEEGGSAIADVIFGQYNPGGRLPLTWYEADYVNQLPMTSMNLRPVDEMGYPGRTYKFFNGSTIYPFGHGLSYTNFMYSVTSPQRSIKKKLAPHQHCPLLVHQPGAFIPTCQSVLIEDMNCEENDMVIEVQVTNTLNVDGSDVIMLYSTLPEGIVGAPIKQLVAFRRVFVPAGQSRTARFELSSCKSLNFVTPTAYTVVPAGMHTMTVGLGDNAVPFNFYVHFSRD